MLNIIVAKNYYSFIHTGVTVEVSFTLQSYVQSYVLRIAFSPYELRLSKRQAVQTQRSTQYVIRKLKTE